jgi:hypothetical protein
MRWSTGAPSGAWPESFRRAWRSRPIASIGASTPKAGMDIRVCIQTPPFNARMESLVKESGPVGARAVDHDRWAVDTTAVDWDACRLARFPESRSIDHVKPPRFSHQGIDRHDDPAA